MRLWFGMITLVVCSLLGTTVLEAQESGSQEAEVGSYPDRICIVENLPIKESDDKRLRLKIVSASFHSTQESSSVTLRVHSEVSDAVVESVFVLDLLDEHRDHILTFPLFYTDDEYLMQHSKSPFTESSTESSWVPEQIQSRYVGSTHFFTDERSFRPHTEKRLPHSIRTVTSKCPASAHLRYIALKYASGGKFVWSDGEWVLPPLVENSSVIGDFSPEVPNAPTAHPTTFAVRLSVSSDGCPTHIRGQNLSPEVEQWVAQLVRYWKILPAFGRGAETSGNLDLLINFVAEGHPYDWKIDAKQLPDSFSVANVYANGIAVNGSRVAARQNDVCPVPK
jgi:hypothetical protein